MDHSVAVDLYNRIVAAGDDAITVNRLFDELCGVFVDGYAVDLAYAGECQRVLDGTIVYPMGDIDAVPDTLVPIVLARGIIGTHGIRIRTSLCPNFNKWVKMTYSLMIPRREH